MIPSPITYVLRAFSIFYPPQKPILFSGVGSTRQLAELMVASGQKRPLLVADGFLLKNGMLDDLLAFFDEAGCTVTIFDGVVPNPTVDVVEAGVTASLGNRCDAVLAVGGGSAIDVGKVIAGASTNRVGLEKLTGLLKLKVPPLPFYVVPTTSGSGSEVTTAAVVSDTQTHKKQFFVDPKYVPLATALDPALLKSMPAEITATTGMDALTHAIEAYTSRNSFVDTDRDAGLAIKLLLDYLPKAYADGSDLKAREMVALASFLAGYAFAKSSLGYVHAISHQVSARYNTPHGRANAVILPRVLRFNKASCAKRFAALEKMLGGGESNAGVDELAGRFIARVDRLSATLHIPVSLPELRDEDFEEIAADALSEARSSYAVPRVMRRKHVEAILRSVASGDVNVAFA